MNRADKAYILAAVFVSATALAYCCTLWLALPLPRYYPTQHAWRCGVEMEGVPSQGWYGAQVFAYLAGAAVTAGAWLALRRLGTQPLGGRATRLIGLAAVAVVILGLAYTLRFEFLDWGIL